MLDANSFVEAVKKASRDEREASKPVNVCFGKVVSKSPLKINVEQKMELGDRQIILTRNVTDFAMRTNSGTILVKNALEVGDGVILVRQQGGQKFIVVDRIQGGK